VSLNPDFDSFARTYAAKKPQALFRRLVADLETPVSAFLKLGFDENNQGRDNAFLLESVQGGEFRGRYSIIGLKPDLVWRVRDGHALFPARSSAFRLGRVFARASQSIESPPFLCQ